MKIKDLKLNRKLVIGIAAVLLIGGSAFAYKSISDAKRKAAENQKAASVTKTDSSIIITGSGTIKSANTYKITPITNGKIKSVYFKEGDKVKANDLMFELDSADAELNVKKLNSALSQAKLELKNNLTSIGYLSIKAPFSGQVSNVLVKQGDVITQGARLLTIADRSKLKLTVPFNSAQINEMKPGLKSEVYLTNIGQAVEGTISYINYNSHATDQSGKLFNVEIVIDNPGALKEGIDASAVVDTASGQISSLEAGTLAYVNSVVIQSNSGGQVASIDLKEDQYVNKGDALLTLSNDIVSTAKDATNLKIQDLEAQLEYAKKQVEDSKIYAPMDGTISKQTIKVGEVVKSGDIISTLTDLDHMELVVSIDETDITNIKLGQKASVKIDALPEATSKSLELKVIKIPVEGDIVNGTTTYPVTFSIDNIPELKAGMNANIEIKIDKTQ